MKTLDVPFPDSGRENSRISCSGAVDMECLNGIKAVNARFVSCKT